MTNHWTPEQMVDSAVANCELEGGVISSEWRQVLLQVATGTLSADDAVLRVIEEAP